MDTIRQLIGTEQDLEQVTRQLRFFVEGLRTPVVGALHVTCSDESEHECIEAFQRGFVDAVLPELKLWSRSPFRSSNLGGRYEWGAVRVAEQHYATTGERAARCSDEEEQTGSGVQRQVFSSECPLDLGVGPLIR